jgi:N-hydroxyarylamine O-acetyltransferase
VTPAGLSDYLRRIAFSDSPAPDLETLVALHRSHVHAIAFENLEIQMGGSIVLDLDALQAKMVQRRRGGYCFEQNTLLMAALRAIGFAVDAREARVRQNSGPVVRPRTHMVLIARCEGHQWLADAGFGGDGLVEPVRMDGTSADQLGTLYRVAAEGTIRVLQRQTADEWEDLYAVQPEVPYAIDFELGNWFTSTHPRSPFVLNLTAQRVIGGARHILRNLTYSIGAGRSIEVRDIARRELVPLLRETFDLDIPADAKFRALDM